MSEPKIAEPGAEKRVRRVRPDRRISKNRSFIWEFTGRSPKTEHFSPVFGVLDTLDSEIGSKNARETQIFSIVRFLLTSAFFKFCFLARSFLAASSRKIAETGGEKRVRRVLPDRLITKNRSFIWEFTGRSSKTGHFSPVFGVFDPLWLKSRLCRRPPAPPQHLHEKAIFEEKRRLA